MNIFSKLAKYDNFWNVLIYLAMAIAAQISAEMYSATLLIAAFTLVPYLLSKCNKVQYIEGKFINAKGKDLSKHLPKKLPLVFVLTIIFCIYTLPKVSSLAREHIDGVLIMLTIGFIPFLYFIFINCPISLLFTGEVNKLYGGTLTYDHHDFFHPRRDYFADERKAAQDRSSSASYSALAGNINYSNYQNTFRKH